MPWRETGPMNERLGLVMDVLEGRFTVTEACQRRNVSRKTAYKYLERFHKEGLSGLEERSRRPHGSPNATSAQVRELLIAAKKARRHWGPKKLVAYLAKRHPRLDFPAASTAGAILKGAGLVESRRRRHPPLAPEVWDRKRTVADAPNRVWCIDFKGEFRLGNGQLCYPLTLIDLFSRDPRTIHALTSTKGAPVIEELTRVFERDGLPEVIRSDRGTPFSSGAIGGISKLAVWWLKLGIRLELNDPGHPEQNGALERMHRTLQAETARPPRDDLIQQQQSFDSFRREYSQERPHEGIGMRCPADLYVPAARPLPAVLPEVIYPGHFEVRSVRANGYIKWAGRQIFVSEVLYRERVGIEPVDEGLWSLYFGSCLLGRFTSQAGRPVPSRSRGAR
jgi:transposase InsO family protein